MKKTVTISSMIGSFVIFLLTIDITNVVVRFITVGELPGGSTIVSADLMLFFTLTALSLVVVCLILGSISYFRLSWTHSHTLPKRRYSAIQ